MKGEVVKQLKHTPGPWCATEGIFEYDGRLHRVIAQDASVAEGIHVPVAAALQNGDGEAQRDANARLIAAAPDLLSVAKDAIEVIEALESNLGSAVGYKCDNLMVGCLRAAIAKAEGGGA